jgi:predicted metal-dependent hydrolase
VRPLLRGLDGRGGRYDAEMAALKYLTAYPMPVQAKVQALIDDGRLAEVLRGRYGAVHGVRTDTALYDYAVDLKNRYLRNAPPLSKVAYDNKLKVIQHALGTHTAVSRVQGTKLKAKREIRIASLFRVTPPEFLKMIVVHELAHLKEREHDKAFYQLCEHMESQYHQLEFDLRLYLTQLDLSDEPVFALG